MRIILLLLSLLLAATVFAQDNENIRVDVVDIELPALMEELNTLREESEESPEAQTTMQVIAIRYANAAELGELINGAQSAAGLLSANGSLFVDERTNTLVITDSPARLEKIRHLVEQLDIPIRQVLIEARIVIAQRDFSNAIGVRFNAQDMSGTPDGESGSQFRNRGLMVDLPITNAAGTAGLAIGRIGSRLLELELSAMETENRGEVISSPRVVTASGQEAEIKQGVQIPFEQATSSGATSIAFRDAVLGLVVTPRITPDDQVQLQLAVNQDSRGEETPDGPAINTQSVRTHVLVGDGETVVLGGVFEQTQREDVRRVPLLSRLPVLGGLFTRRAKVDDRTELLVFVTPRILEPSLERRNALESPP